MEIKIRNPRDRLILNLLEKEGALAPGEIAKRLDIPRLTITRRIGGLAL